MEMMVTVAISGLLILLVHQIFNSVVRAVENGKDVSTIIDHATAFSTQMFADGKQMITHRANPHTHPELVDQPAAFLVIIQQTNTGVRFPAPRKQRQPMEDWGVSTDPIHSAQLLLFRDADLIDAMTPAAADRYDSDARAQIAAVWYGHLAPPDANGGATGVEIGVGPDNDAAPRLVLGRQALLIVDRGGRFPNGAELAAAGLFYADFEDANDPLVPSDPAADAVPGHPGVAVRAVYDLDVTGTPGDDYNNLWEGATDVLAIDDSADGGNRFFFHEMFAEEIDGPGSVPGLYAVTTAHANPDYQRPRTGFTDMLDAFWMPTAAYKTMARNWGYSAYGYRLTGAQKLTYPYTPQQVGRMHPFFIPHVSDFAVDFAADITDDYDADGDYRFRVAAGAVAANVAFSADGLPDATPDEYASLDANGTLVKAIKWYNAVAPNPDLDGDGVGDVDPAKTITWPIPADAVSNPTQQQHGPYHSPLVLGPTVNGAPYPPYVAHLQTPYSTIHRRAVFVFGHTPDLDLYNADAGDVARTAPDFGDGADAAGAGEAKGFESGCAKWWPYLIRIRYRLHDNNGSFSSIDEVSQAPIVGKWFEQIIPVPRPPQ